VEEPFEFTLFAEELVEPTGLFGPAVKIGYSEEITPSM
jgi:hypothetical protein